MPTKPSTVKSPNLYYPPTTNAVDRAAWDRINFLLRQIEEINERLTGLGSGEQARKIGELQVQIAAVQDQLTQGGTFVNAGQSAFSPSSLTISASGDGITISGASDAAVINIVSPSTTRSALGLGGLATLNPGIAVPNNGVVAGAGYVQADFQSLIDSFNALATSLRNAGIIAP